MTATMSCNQVLLASQTVLSAFARAAESSSIHGKRRVLERWRNLDDTTPSEARDGWQSNKRRCGLLDTGSDILDSAAEEGTGLSNIMVEGSILREPTRILTCCGFRGVTSELVTLKGGWSTQTGTMRRP
jgi:hypothetical protein